MLHAITKTRFESSVNDRFERGQSGIVMVMMARYSIEMVEKMIKENFDYWDISAGKVVDIYLAGYGAYLPIDNTNKDNKIVEGTELYFNNKAFRTFKKALYSDIGLQYDDRVEIFLINYYENKLHYKESLRIDVGESIGVDQEGLRRLMAFLINACEKFSDIYSLKKTYKLYKAKRQAKSTFMSMSIDGMLSLVFSFVK